MMSYYPNYGYPTGPAPPPGNRGYPPSANYPPSGGYPAHGQSVSYFYVKSVMNGLVLDIEGGVASPGRRVVTYTQKNMDADNQLWYEDAVTGTLRTKLAPSMCLTFNGTEMVIDDFNPDKKHQQQFDHRGDKIFFRQNPNMVLDIAEARREPLSKVTMYQANAAINQQWLLEPYGHPSSPVPSPGHGGYPHPSGGIDTSPRGYPADGQSVSYFYIKSVMNGLVLDIEGGEATAGKRLVTYSQRHTNADNQLWYEDCATGTIRSKLAPSMCLTYNGTQVIIDDLKPDKAHQQQFDKRGEQIYLTHNPTMVLDIAEAMREPLAKVTMYPANDGDNQKWTLEPYKSFSPASAPSIQPGEADHPANHGHRHQGWWLIENCQGPPSDAICVGHQTDGGGAYQCAVAHTEYGDIPGKAQGNTCWFPFGGRESVTKHFSWICAPHGRARLVENHNNCPCPCNAVLAGKQNDVHAGRDQVPYSAAIAHTGHGEIPGKARDHTCWYPYGGRELTTDSFSWVTV